MIFLAIGFSAGGMLLIGWSLFKLATLSDSGWDS